MSVTAITYAVNNSEKSVHIKCFENKDKDGHDVTIKSNENASKPSIYMWIPYCDSQNEMDEGKYITVDIKLTSEIYYLYQHGGFIRYSHTKIFDTNAPAVPGHGIIRGDRSIIIDKEGNWSFQSISA